MPLSSENEGHRLAGNQIGTDLVGFLIDLYPDQTAAPMRVETKRPPGRRQVGIQAQSIGTQRQAAKTEYCCLPQSAKCRDVDAAGAAVGDIRKIGCRRLLEVAGGKIHLAQSGSSQGVHAPAERAAVAAALLIVLEIRQPGPRIAFFRQQGQQGHDVGLLHHLGSLCPLSSEDDVEGYRAFSVSRQIDRVRDRRSRQTVQTVRFPARTR